MIREELLTRYLARFTRAAWDVVEPGRQLVWGWHMDAICEHLEAVFIWGQISHLLIELPPGCTKTKLTGTMLPAWLWTRKPNYRWLFVGNSQELTNAESMVCRNLIESEWYRRTFRIPWTLADDQDAKAWFKNTAGGERLCRGILANTQGRKGDCVLTDDANDARKVSSEAERRRVNTAYDAAIYNRVIDFKLSPRIIIAQRTGDDDLIGHCKRQGGWECLTIPEEFDRRFRTTTCIGWTDPRKFDGEMLRPNQFGAEQIERERKKNLLIYQAQHLQRPRSADGIRFKSAWFRNRWRYHADRHHIILQDHRGEYQVNPYGIATHQRYGTVDGASSERDSADYTVISTWIITDRFDLVWFGCRRLQLQIPEQPAELEKEYRKYKMEFVGVEADGQPALYQLATRLRMTVRKMTSGRRDKLAKATPAIILAESGRVWLPDEDAAYTNDFPLGEVETEVFGFTGIKGMDAHDDIVDTLSYGVEVFNEEDTGGGGVSAPEANAPPPSGAWMQGNNAYTPGRNPFLRPPGAP